ncbi:MBL fold metallo-hydrolase [Actinokineospora sp.]|uniref:MBL fold metallo-hydrolase n=1 Tax=Actinokineospora sp. TaxID=1872133 RepID=UPI0040383F28
MKWIELADGVFARRYVELDQTLGLVVGGQRCLVVDTGTDEVHGAEFADAIREITALPWTVVITHAHWDHFLGTRPFLPAPVWAHPRCGATMTADAHEQVASWAGKYADAGKPELAERLRRAELVLPDHEVADRAEVDLGGRTVVLAHLGRGHTDHDVVAHVPDAAVVFAGDLVEQGAPPSIGSDAHPLEWPATLDAVVDLGARTVVPGHGGPVDAGFVRGQRAELAVVAGLLDGVRSGTLTVEDALARSPYPAAATRPALERARVA